jgi:hypothetical protein
MSVPGVAAQSMRRQLPLPRGSRARQMCPGRCWRVRGTRQRRRAGWAPPRGYPPRRASSPARSPAVQRGARARTGSRRPRLCWQRCRRTGRTMAAASAETGRAYGLRRQPLHAAGTADASARPMLPASPGIVGSRTHLAVSAALAPPATTVGTAGALAAGEATSDSLARVAAGGAGDGCGVAELREVRSHVSGRPTARRGRRRRARHGTHAQAQRPAPQAPA